eukprot:COSAG05_NODE_2511_length_2962_cov_2.243451_1_plen_823_part_00
MVIIVRPQNPRDPILLSEKFNSHHLRKFIALGLCTDSEYEHRLGTYLKAAGDGNSIDVTYNDCGIGRLESEQISEKHTTTVRQINMWNDAKHACLHGVYHDVDVKCAHPTFLWQILKQENLKYEQCKHYADNSQHILSALTKSTGKDKTTCKALLYKMLYGGRTKTWLKEHGVSKDKIPIEFTQMQAEVVDSAKQLLERYPMYTQKAVELKGSDYYNIQGTALSLLAQTSEKNVLCAMYDHFNSNPNLEIGALIHDGLHLKTTDVDTKAGTISEDILRNAEQYVKQTTGFDIRLEIKPFTLPVRIQNCFDMPVDNHARAGQWLLKQIGNDLVSDQSRTFYKHDHCWVEKEKDVKRLLLNRVMTYDVLDTRYRQISKNMDQAAKICQYVLNHTPEQPGFVEELWQSSIGKLCFKNGWFDFESQTLKDYNDKDTPHTLFKINRDFREPTPEAKQLLQTKVFEPIFVDKDRTNLFMQFLARSIAGMYADKQWMVGLGERNSGKGVLMTLSEHSFGQYVKATNSENLLCKQGSTADVAKSLSWLIDYEFKRLAFSNEIEMSDNAAINGALVKKLTSGGDILEARKNYVDEKQFKSQAHLLILANDMPPCRPADCLETCLHMPFPTTFVDEDDERIGQPGILAKDNDIKTICKQTDVLDAFTWAVCREFYTNAPVHMPKSLVSVHTDFVEQDDTKSMLLNLFDFSGKDEHRMTVQEVDVLIKENNIHGVSKQKYGKWLKDHGAQKKKDPISGRYSWCGIQNINCKVTEHRIDPSDKARQSSLDMLLPLHAQRASDLEAAQKNDPPAKRQKTDSNNLFNKFSGMNSAE